MARLHFLVHGAAEEAGRLDQHHEDEEEGEGKRLGEKPEELGNVERHVSPILLLPLCRRGGCGRALAAPQIEDARRQRNAGGQDRDGDERSIGDPGDGNDGGDVTLARVRVDGRDLSELISLTFMSDEELREVTEKLQKMVNGGNNSLSNLSRELGLSQVFIRGVAKRAEGLAVRGQRIEPYEEDF